MARHYSFLELGDKVFLDETEDRIPIDPIVSLAFGNLGIQTLSHGEVKEYQYRTRKEARRQEADRLGFWSRHLYLTGIIGSSGSLTGLCTIFMIATETHTRMAFFGFALFGFSLYLLGFKIQQVLDWNWGELT